MEVKKMEENLLTEIQKDYKSRNKKTTKLESKPEKKKSYFKAPLVSTVVFTILILLATATYNITLAVNNFFANNRLVNQKVITLQMPFRIEKREEVKLVEYRQDIPEGLTDIETLICQKWDIYDCQIALAVAKGEGLNHPVDGFNINTNGTIDVGIFRINSIHFNKEGCSLAEVITVEGNINCAYKIWEKSGWNAWVAYTNGSFQKHLK